jgi:hypothetical protein
MTPGPEMGMPGSWSGEPFTVDIYRHISGYEPAAG